MSALQVDDGNGWGNVNLRSDKRRSTIAELTELMWRWRASNVFGSHCKFRIHQW